MFDFFISDPHFYHKNIIKYCHRPFENVKRMNEEMIDAYNSMVSRNGRVLFCGDTFFCGTSEAKKIMSALNGKKFLVIGNHDQAPHKMIERGFEMVAEVLFTKIEDRPIRICHYDYWNLRSPWDNRYQELRQPEVDGEILIHGHTHQKHPVLLNQINVGVDAWNFCPVPMDEVAKLVKKIPDMKSEEAQAKRKLLFEYRGFVRDKAIDDKREAALIALTNNKFDEFRSLGWEHEIATNRAE